MNNQNIAHSFKSLIDTNILTEHEQLILDVAYEVDSNQDWLIMGVQEFSDYVDETYILGFENLVFEERSLEFYLNEITIQDLVSENVYILMQDLRDCHPQNNKHN